MGGSNSKTIEDIVNDVTNSVTVKVFNSNKTDQTQLSDNTIRQIARDVHLENINCKTINVNDAVVNAKMGYVANAQTTMETDIQNELAQKLEEKLRQMQKLRTELGSNLFQFNNAEQELHLKNTIKNIVDTSVTNEVINNQLQAFNANIAQETRDVFVKNLKCGPDGTLTVNRANVIVDAQANMVAKALTNNIMKNTLTQTLVQDIQQTQDVSHGGLAQLAKALMPFLLLFAVLFFTVGKAGETGIKAVTNWKLWAILFGLGVPVIILMYHFRIWPWKMYYSQEVDAEGLRTGKCKADKEGQYTSKQKCEAAAAEPKNAEYKGRFVGYDKQAGVCRRFPDIVAKGPNGTTIYATFTSDAECKAAHDDFWTPKYTATADSETTNLPTYPCKQIGYRYTRCDPENMSTYVQDKTIAELPRLRYKSPEACLKAIADQKYIYVPNCILNDKGEATKETCEYQYGYIGAEDANKPVGKLGRDVGYQNQNDICGIK
jgi:hypothetical protein